MLARWLWLAIALAALGLWASLLPQVTYTSASSGEPAGDVLIAWPGWGVQQDLGPVSESVGRFQIWVSAEPDRDYVTVRASLVDAATREVLRQTFIEATPGYIPVPRTLTFPSYVVPEGQRLLLQLQVQLPETSHVTYRLASPQPELANARLNGVPDSGSGPLALAHLETGSGLRAAVGGEPAERSRLVLSVALSVLASLLHPRVTAGLRRMGVATQAGARRPARWLGRLGGPSPDAGAGASPTAVGRVLATPWYPWPAAAIPILHFLTSNPLHFAPIEAVIPLGAALAVVTGGVVGLRLFLKDWHRPAAATAGVTVVFFAYGHIERALDGNLDERALFAGAVALAAAAAIVAIGAGTLAARGTQLLNLTAAVLLAFPLASLSGGLAASIGRSPAAESLAAADPATHLLPSGLPTASGARPDIYYIILDSYTRDEGLGEFDNSDFLGELERRGFYVASEAVSNYRSSVPSILSSLNMTYTDELRRRFPKTGNDSIKLAQNHALGAILKSMGYTYVHLESGFIYTSKSTLADIIMTFTPGGVRASDSSGGFSGRQGSPRESLVSSGFIRSLIDTTALKPVAGHYFAIGEAKPYSFWSSRRTIDMFEFLTDPIDSDSPKFVFAHLNKPHGPATFDRHGNYIEADSPTVAFRRNHDPSVPEPYIGQLIYINSLVLRMIDSILQASEPDPIIVISADHGRDKPGILKYYILSAFHLPEGGNEGLYPSITPVNHFRYILDYYFGLALGLLEDRIVGD